MWRNRILYVILLILTLVLASHYGGNMVYILLYTVTLLPVFSLAYTFVVFRRFFIYQEIPTRITEKYTVLSYSLILENRDYFSFDNIRFVCNEPLARLSPEIDLGTLHMNPQTSRALSGTMRCLYRGTYYVGIEGVEVTDFFGLFRITYAFPSRVRMTVKPRVLSLEELQVTENTNDAKKNFYTTQMDTVLGNDMRGYRPGDSARQINWKVSARYQELYVRKPDVRELEETVLCMDTYRYWKAENDCIIHSDAIIETALSIAKHYSDRGLQLTVVFHDKKDVSMPMTNVRQFQDFYEKMCDICFEEQYPVEQAANAYCTRKKEQVQHVIMVVYKVTDGVAAWTRTQLEKGQQVTIVMTGPEELHIALPKECHFMKVVPDYEVEY